MDYVAFIISLVALAFAVQARQEVKKDKKDK